MILQKGRSRDGGSTASPITKLAKKYEEEEEKEVGTVGIPYLSLVGSLSILYLSLSLILGKIIS